MANTSDNARTAGDGSGGTVVRALQTFPKAARYLGLSHQTMYRWATQDDFPFEVRKIQGTQYLSTVELDAWLARKAS